ncbi:MAG: hypothetical protein MJ107_00720 [Lachnospiraceae bacterium]|nr:hypothetical protein [Lachnospiraceae bacterium]
MAKKISNNWWSRFTDWLDIGSGKLDDSMMSSFDDETSPSSSSVELQKDALRHEKDIDDIRNNILEHEQSVYDSLHTGFTSKGAKHARRFYMLAAMAFCIGIIALLLNTVEYLPEFGNPDNPVNNEVSERYIEKGMEETGAVNIVAGMILDYRAFDTLGESNVLFVAACAVLILLRISVEKEGDAAVQLEMEADDRMYEPKDDIILQTTATILVPLTLLFGMYIIMNGHISPGGGFSGGAVMGAALILYLNAFGFEKTERFFTFKTFKAVSVCALSFYAVSKAYSFFTGANHLHSIISPGTPGKLFSAGLIPYLNLAVGLVVCCTMYAFYTLFRKGDM